MRFCLLDRICSLEPGVEVTAVKAVSLAEEYLGTVGVFVMSLYVLSALKNVLLVPAVDFARFLFANRQQLIATWRPAAVLTGSFLLLVAFLYPWASLFRELSCNGVLDAAGVCTGTSSMFGLVEMLVFLLILVIALAYIWRKRALDWA